jgi:hypothetical protein
MKRKARTRGERLPRRRSRPSFAAAAGTICCPRYNARGGRANQSWRPRQRSSLLKSVPRKLRVLATADAFFHRDEGHSDEMACEVIPIGRRKSQALPKKAARRMDPGSSAVIKAATNRVRAGSGAISFAPLLVHGLPRSKSSPTRRAGASCGSIDEAMTTCRPLRTLSTTRVQAVAKAKLLGASCEVTSSATAS